MQDLDCGTVGCLLYCAISAWIPTLERVIQRQYIFRESWFSYARLKHVINRAQCELPQPWELYIAVGRYKSLVEVQ